MKHLSRAGRQALYGLLTLACSQRSVGPAEPTRAVDSQRAVQPSNNPKESTVRGGPHDIGFRVHAMRALSKQGTKTIETSVNEHDTLRVGDRFWFEVELTEELYLYVVKVHQATENANPEYGFLYPTTAKDANRPCSRGNQQFPPDGAYITFPTGIELFYLFASRSPMKSSDFRVPGLVFAGEEQQSAATNSAPQLPATTSPAPDQTSAPATATATATYAHAPIKTRHANPSRSLPPKKTETPPAPVPTTTAVGNIESKTGAPVGRLSEAWRDALLGSGVKMEQFLIKSAHYVGR